MIIEKDLKIDDSVIHYKVAGNNLERTLVFLHGRPGSEYLRSSVIDELSKDFYVIAPEHPWLLRSDPLKNYIDIFDQYADIVSHILIQENLDKKAHIVMGQSFGGIVASTFAEKYKSNIKALILTDAQMGAQKHDLLRKVLFKYGRKILLTYLLLPNHIKKHGLKIFFGIISKHKSRKHNNKLIRARVNMVDNCCNLFRQAIKQNNNLLCRDYGDLPVIMLRGDRDGAEFNISGYCKVKDAKETYGRLKASWTRVEFLTVNGSHTVLYEKPNMVIAEVKKALNKYIDL